MLQFQPPLIQSEEIAEDTLALWFERPADFSFTAGQFVHIELTNPAEFDKHGTSRPLSIVSAPENTAHLQLVTRLRDTAFKRQLATLEPGSTDIEIEGPYGAFTFHEDNTTPAVFLAGGIGITPFVSILRHATAQAEHPSITVIHSNRQPATAPFLNELTAIAEQHQNIRYVPTMTDLPAQHAWDGATDYVDGSFLTRHIDDIHEPVYYIVGTPAMVTDLRRLLREELSVNTDRIRTEEFMGY